MKGQGVSAAAAVWTKQLPNGQFPQEWLFSYRITSYKLKVNIFLNSVIFFYLNYVGNYSVYLIPISSKEIIYFIFLYIPYRKIKYISICSKNEMMNMCCIHTYIVILTISASLTHSLLHIESHTLTLAKTGIYSHIQIILISS